jgi:hypothetical protein
MGRESKMPCFQYGVQQATNSLRQRFQLQLSADEAECKSELSVNPSIADLIDTTHFNTVVKVYTRRLCSVGDWTACYRRWISCIYTGSWDREHEIIR